MLICKRVSQFSWLIILLFLAVPPQAALGLPVTVSFSGTIGQVGMGYIPIDDFAIGDSFYGSFTYDSETPLIVAYPDGRSIYYPYGSFSVATGGLTFYRNESASIEWYLIVENTTGYDRLTLWAYTTGPSVSGSDMVDFYPYRSILMLDGPPTLFSSGAVPTGPIPLSSFSSSYFTMDLYPYPYGSGGGIFSGFSGSLETLDINAVPEPTSLLLLGTGLGALGLAARRRKE